MFAHSFFLTHPNSWRKIVCAHFPWNNLYFSRNSHFIFFIFFRYHFHWYSIRYGNCLRWGSQQLDMNVNIKQNNYQNIIRADSENFFNGGGRGCKLWSQEHKSFLLQITSWPPILTSPSPPPHPALLAVTQIFHYQQNQQMSVELICDPVMDGEKPPFATEWPPSPLKNLGHNSAYCCQVSRPHKEGEGSAKNRAETMGKYSTDSEENWFSDNRSKRNSSHLYL